MSSILSVVFILLSGEIFFATSTNADSITNQEQYAPTRVQRQLHLDPREMPPPPNLPVQPVVPIASSLVSDLPPGPQRLETGQCDFGTNSSYLQNTPQLIYVDTNRLYVDVGRPALCSGEIVRWEVCFTLEDYAASNTITFVVLRYDKTSRGYRIESVYSLDIDPIIGGGSDESVTAVCRYIESSEPIPIQTRDLLGFVCNDNIRVALVSIPDGRSGSLKVYNITASNRQRMSKRELGAGEVRVAGHGRVERNTPEELLGGIGSLQSTLLEDVAQNLTPLLRIVMNSSNDTDTSVMPTPSKTHTNPCPRPTNDGGGDGIDNIDIINSTIFIATVIVAVVIIFVLFLLVCFLCCCLCQTKFKCCPCRRRNGVTHTIRVEPLTDHSMQYNDMYVPSDPHHIITDGRKYSADIRHNPAYVNCTTNKSSSGVSSSGGQVSFASYNPSENCPGASGNETEISDLQQQDTSRRHKTVMEHTYEMIESVN